MFFFVFLFGLVYLSGMSACTSMASRGDMIFLVDSTGPGHLAACSLSGACSIDYFDDVDPAKYEGFIGMGVADVLNVGSNRYFGNFGKASAPNYEEVPAVEVITGVRRR